MGARITKRAQHTVIGASNEHRMASNVLRDKCSWFGKFACPPNDVSTSTKQNIEFFLESSWVGKNCCWLSH
jgi:hypothetical protein